MPHENDADLLFGILALQGGLVATRTFVDECSAWAIRPEGSLADRLERKKLIDRADRAAVDRRLNACAPFANPFPSRESVRWFA
jgi:hypothetical protein